MNDRTNYSGHHGAGAPRPLGIVFRVAGERARFSPYMWLVHADMMPGEITLDFGSYDVVVRAAVANPVLKSIFEAITRHECAEIEEKEHVLMIEVIEKDEAAAAA